MQISPGEAKINHHIYFRHGPRLNLNLDPPLKPNSKEAVQQVGRKIASLYGLPKEIIVSPYLRTRQTASIFSQLFVPSPELKVDVRLSEKLNIRKRTGKGPPGNYDPVTASYSGIPGVGETDLQVKTRLSQHLADFSSQMEETWFVCHGYLLEALVELYGEKLPYPPPSLTAIIIPRIDFDSPNFWFRVSYPKESYLYTRRADGQFLQKREIP